MGVQKENMAIETAKLEKLREEVAEEVAQLAKEKAEVEAGRGEADRIRLENEKVSAELESKIVEAKRLSGGREASLEAIKLEKAAVDTELKKTQLLKDETTAEAERNREILEKIEEAQKSAAETFDTVRAEREENERIKAIAQAEVGSADFIKNEAHRLVMIFRQALQTYISVNGSTIKIPELTIEDLKFVAKDLISQIPDFDFFAEFPEAFADKDTSGTAPTEVNWDKLTKPQLVIEGREKFGLEMSMELTQKDMVATLVDAKNKAITE